MICTHLFILASLATVSTASSEKKSPPPPDTRRLAHLTGSSDSAAAAQLTRNMGALLTDMAALLTDMDALLTTTVTTDDDDGTAYAVTLVPGATVAALWQALAEDGTLNRTNYYLHGLKHLRLARTRTLAGVLTSLLPGAPGTKVQRLIGRFARSGAPLPDSATVADYLTIVATARPELITAFDSAATRIEPADATQVTISGDSNETAEHEADYNGFVRLGPLGPRGTPLRARLRLDRLGNGARIGLVREEAWADVDNTGMAPAGWTYHTCGRLYANSHGREAQELPPVVEQWWDVVVEVELRWDAETGVGHLLYTIDGAAQDPAFQIPAEGGRVGLAVSLFRTRMTLLAE